MAQDIEKEVDKEIRIITGEVSDIKRLRGLWKDIEVSLKVDGREEKVYRRVGEPLDITEMRQLFYNCKGRVVKIKAREMRTPLFDWLMDRIFFVSFGIPRKYNEIAPESYASIVKQVVSS
jgi:hypothetical protein